MATTRRDGENSIPEAKRDGRDGVDPEKMPGEFADDMHVNRFHDTPPPSPPEDDRDDRG